jgi:GGDEF domain-containing protein
MSDRDGAKTSGQTPRRGEKARHHVGSFISTRINPSPELLSLLAANPGADLRLTHRGDEGSDTTSTLQVPAFRLDFDAVAENISCPHCAADFSVAYVGRARPGDESHDFIVCCPKCAERVIVVVPRSLEPDDVVVGPPRSVAPAADVLKRGRALRSADSSLTIGPSETIATLEMDRDSWRLKARTDAVTGLLNERAHIEDAEDETCAHAVLHIPEVQGVYDECGQSSGNQYARDTARMIESAAGEGVRVYRIGTAKFAMIAADIESVRRATETVRAALRNAVSSIAESGGSQSARDAPSLGEFLAQHPKPYGLTVRLRWER